MITKIYSQEKPEVLLSRGPHMLVRFHIEPQEDGSYAYEELFVRGGSIGGALTRDHIITLLVRTRYSADQMEAALFNNRPNEIAEIQAWRTEAKQIATEVMSLIKAQEYDEPADTMDAE